MFERLRALRGGSTAPETRYPEPEDYTPPEEVEDPHTLDDSTESTWRDWIAENKLFVFSMSLLGLGVLIAVAIYAGRYFITFLLNPWVHRLAVGGGIATGAYFAGRSAYRSQIERQDELTLYDPEEGESLHFLGRYEGVDGAGYDLFVPLKGYRRRGHDPEPYRIGELSRDLVENFNRNPRATARIRLHASVTTVTPTDRGRKVVQLTAGIDPAPFDREANLEATLPDMAAESTVSDLKTELEKTAQRVRHLEDKQDVLERQRDEAISAARKPREEVLEEEIKPIADVLVPFATRGRGQTDDEEDSRDGNRERKYDRIIDELSGGED